MKKRLWDKGEDLNEAIHRFTVGDDPTIDAVLLPWDLLASAAHAKMLRSIDLLSEDELTMLLGGLAEISKLHERGEFPIPFELEDCHTAIENYLVSQLGNAGRKIHTGRSRNDQVLVMVRLYLRAQVIAALHELHRTAEGLLMRARDVGHAPLPGHTHLQPAMPSSVAMWLAAFAEHTLTLAQEGRLLLTTLDTNPLGAGSGFGIPLPLDRAMTTTLLGFSRVQRNPIHVQNSRGLFELKVLRWASDVALLMEKFAWDLIFYSSHELGILALPASLTTGSSIMPQKRNPDVAELLRARAAKIRGAEQELLWVVAKLPSNYHRDFQYTKEPLVRGLRHLHECIPVLQELVRSFTVRSDRTEQHLTPDLYATYDAYRAVREGTPFRDAYAGTAEKFKRGEISVSALRSDFGIIAAVIDGEIAEAEAELAAAKQELGSYEARVSNALASLFTATPSGPALDTASET